MYFILQKERKSADPLRRQILRPPIAGSSGACHNLLNGSDPLPGVCHNGSPRASGHRLYYVSTKERCPPVCSLDLLRTKYLAKNNVSCLLCVKKHILNFSCKTAHSFVCVHKCKTTRFCVRNCANFFRIILSLSLRTVPKMIRPLATENDAQWE